MQWWWCAEEQQQRTGKMMKMAILGFGKFVTRVRVNFKFE
jgi:hypothetical protein